MSLFQRLFKRPRDSSAPPEERARGFARLAGVVLGLFAVVFVVGALQVLGALHSGKVWTDFRGEVVSRTEMHHELILLAVGAVVSAALSWRFRRFWRRGQ
jgi:hypothetical protein